MNADEVFEVWVLTIDGRWSRAKDKRSGMKVWPSRSSAHAIAEVLADDVRVEAVRGIRRTLSFTILGKGKPDENGQAEADPGEDIPSGPESDVPNPTPQS